MHGDDDVAWQGRHLGDARFERGRNVRRLAFASVSKIAAGIWVQAVRIHDVQATVAFARGPRPRRAAGRVTGRHVRRQGQRPHLDGLALAHHLDLGDFRDMHDGIGLVLRVIVAIRATLQPQGARGAGHYRGAAGPLQRGDAARMVPMRMRIEDDFHILDAKAQRLDAGDDQGRRLRQRAVEQDMALRTRHQHGGQTGRAHIPAIAIHVERLDGRIPFLAIITINRFILHRGRRLRLHRTSCHGRNRSQHQLRQ